MKSLLEIFVNESRAIIRSKTLFLLLLTSVAWMFGAPYVFTGDGTASGLRQLSLHYSLGGVAALLVVSLTISATGSIARERSAKRLALTMVRPVRYFVIAWGKILAYVVSGALVLAICTFIEGVRSPSVDCRHVLKPMMPSVMEEAEHMYTDFMASSNTPAKVKQMKRSVVLQLLANRARDRFDTIVTNSTWSWKFNLDTCELSSASTLAARFRFSTNFDQREDVRGRLSIGAYQGTISNITQAVIETPLHLTQRDAVSNELVFHNLGANQLMLRPRCDVELLVPADSFAMNLVRAYLELVSLLALLVAFGVFLGSALGRPSALFTAIAVLLINEMAPSVIDRYADELETSRANAVGLVITRAAACVVRPVSSLRPLAALSLDECIEPEEVIRVLAVDLVALPLILALLSALIMPRKQDF